LTYLSKDSFDRRYAQSYLEKLFGKEAAGKILHDLKKGNFEAVLKMRRPLFFKFVTRDAKSLRTYIEFLIKDTIRRFGSSKKSTVIALIGVDGSGKSTTSEGIKKHFETYIGKKCDIVYMGRGRNRALPGARSTMKKIGLSLPHPDKIKHQNKVIGKMLYMARDMAYVLDAFARYVFFIYFNKRKGVNIITDRYAYDIMLNENTLGATRKLIINFYPRPDFVIYLYNSPQILYDRKLQHGTEKLLADMKILEKVADELSAKKINVLKIKTDDINETLEKICENIK
jgi:thymidylate kinase